MLSGGPTITKFFPVLVSSEFSVGPVGSFVLHAALCGADNFMLSATRAACCYFEQQKAVAGGRNYF